MRGAVIVVGFAAVSIMGIVGTAMAASMEALQGAWAMTDCADTFEFSGGKAKFKDRGSSLNTGVLITGDKIEGANATCTANHINESNGQYKVHMSCADTIMFSSVTINFTMVDPQHFRRIDPDFPEVTEDYQKCMPPQ